MRLVDVHCHPTDVESEREATEAIARAMSAGVTAIIAAGYDTESNGKVLELSLLNSAIWTAVGFHPWFAPGAITELEAALKSPRILAIGEAGLDGMIETPVDKQLTILRQQLDLAKQVDLPVILHCRNAAEPMYHELKNRRALRGMLHSFNSGIEAARPFVSMGLYFSISGIVTMPGATRFQKLAALLPEDRLLLESDWPALPVWKNGRARAEPADLPQILAKLAELRGTDPERLSERILENTVALFGACLR